MSETRSGLRDVPGEVEMSTPAPERDGPDGAVCSAKGCQAEAAWDLLWNNPKLHTPDRRKSWLACDAHRESLSSFLAARKFLVEVRPLDG